jgi:polysaccharide deacetylase family protein (PEP-CTERM system associated)
MIRRALPPLRNALTVDVEDWFQVQAYAGTIARAEWDRLPRRVEANTDRLLALFAAAGVRATFFTLGWVAARHPGLIRRIVAAGHELASHGYGHAPVDTLDAASFRADIARARALLQDTGGAAVRGYRAPTFSLGPRTPWAWDLLAETGHAYSSSVYPVRLDV